MERGGWGGFPASSEKQKGRSLFGPAVAGSPIESNCSIGAFIGGVIR
jgi:hypothetical protein